MKSDNYACINSPSPKNGEGVAVATEEVEKILPHQSLRDSFPASREAEANNIPAVIASRLVGAAIPAGIREKRIKNSE